MYKIGEFSLLGKTTVKTLRYYEKEKLLIPTMVDENGYRYYDANKLIELAKIVSLRQVGFTINEIKKIMSGNDFMISLNQKKQELENSLIDYKLKISKINYLLGEDKMKYEAVIKELPECIVYYSEGTLADYSKVTEFIMKSDKEFEVTNPDIKGIVPEYCFSEYLDGEYREKNISYRYSRAVTKEGLSTNFIKFKKLAKVNAVCVYHKGHYNAIGEAYGFIMKYIEENGYQVKDFPRERYIDGIWNKENPNDWLTEIQVPIAN